MYYSGRHLYTIKKLFHITYSYLHLYSNYLMSFIHNNLFMYQSFITYFLLMRKIIGSRFVTPVSSNAYTKLIEIWLDTSFIDYSIFSSFADILIFIDVIRRSLNIN